MEKIKIGVSGNMGSFSEEAANYYCAKNEIKDYDLEYLINVANVLRALNNGEIAKAVFPIENSNGGIVYEAVYAMSSYNFKIENIFEIDIQHCLLVKQGVKLDKIKKIVSHPQALKQCRMYLKRKLSNIELQEYSDTASAAKDISAGELPKHCATIAPKICARLYKLDILGQGIQDLKFNFTTFIAAIKQSK
ncbi:MAG: prephenate dehydratase domain-containing protein [Patescibacteria group bacterium]|nr:prephenate dehydratase domain-containing protein [Patescibacteria group bacterium]